MGNSKSLYSKQEFLHYYIQKNDVVNIGKLIEANPQLINDPLTKDTKQTALMRVAYNGNLELVKLLISLKANPNYSTPKGQTALTTAIKRNHQKVVEYLIGEGADITHVSQIGLRVVEYAVLPGFYQLARLIFFKLDKKNQQVLQDPDYYYKLGKKYAYRYVNYDQFLEGLVMNKEPQEMPNFLKKQKVRLIDPVVDPRQTWKQWLKRTMQWKDAPLVERSDLPQQMQPQNRTFGKLHHYTNNFMSTPLSQKTSLKPKNPLDNRQVVSQMGDMNTRKAVGRGTQDKMNYQVQSQV